VYIVAGFEVFTVMGEKVVVVIFWSFAPYSLPAFQMSILHPYSGLAEAVCSSEILVCNQKATWHNNPKDHYHL
jgi:hypothetical protein